MGRREVEKIVPLLLSHGKNSSAKLTTRSGIIIRGYISSGVVLFLSSKDFLEIIING